MQLYLRRMCSTGEDKGVFYKEMGKIHDGGNILVSNKLLHFLQIKSAKLYSHVICHDLFYFFDTRQLGTKLYNDLMQLYVFIYIADIFTHDMLRDNVFTL